MVGILCLIAPRRRNDHPRLGEATLLLIDTLSGLYRLRGKGLMTLMHVSEILM